jgi:hypothetical protein
MGMTLLVFALILILIVALAIYAIDLIPLVAPFNMILKLLVLVIAIVLLCEKAGLV